MSKLEGKMYHPNGSTINIYSGFSWTCLLFGLFWFMYNKMWFWSLKASLLILFTVGLAWIILPFFANELYLNAMLKNGYLESVCKVTLF